jgi:hypothetical protein
MSISTVKVGSVVDIGSNYRNRFPQTMMGPELFGDAVMWQKRDGTVLFAWR